MTDEVIAAAVAVHRHFGPGVLESIYVRCLEQALKVAGHVVEREKTVTISYMGATFEEKLRCDLLVDNCLVIEAKSVEPCDHQRFRMQLLSYMKLLDKPLGLVMNFGEERFGSRGIRRVILKNADDSDCRPHDCRTNEALHGCIFAGGDDNRNRPLHLRPLRQNLPREFLVFSPTPSATPQRFATISSTRPSA